MDTMESGLTSLEFNEHTIEIKLSENMKRRFVIREMTAERVVEYEADQIKLAKALIDLGREAHSKSDVESNLQAAEKAKEISAEFVCKLLIPIDGLEALSPSVVRRCLSYRHREWIVDKQAKLNNQGEVKDVSFFVIKSLEYERTRANPDGTIPKGSESSEHGSLPSLDLEGLWGVLGR